MTDVRVSCDWPVPQADLRAGSSMGQPYWPMKNGGLSRSGWSPEARHPRTGVLGGDPGCVC